IEDCADDREIESGARFRETVGAPVSPPERFISVFPVHDEMPPSRMKRNSQRRICRAHGRDNQFGRRVELLQVDAKIRKSLFKPKLEHAMRSRANSLGIQKSKCAVPVDTHD